MIKARCTHPDAVIPLDTGDAVPIFRRQYRVAESRLENVSAIIDGWLHEGVICLAPAGCQWNSPLVVVKKPGSSDPEGVWVCMDPRRINSVLRSGDNFPIPVISDIIEQLAGASVFSALDLTNLQSSSAIGTS